MLYPVINLLYFYISTFRSLCAVLTMAAFLPSTFLRYFLNDIEMVPVAPVIYWYQFRCYIPYALYLFCQAFVFENLLTSVLIILLSPEIATCSFFIVTDHNVRFTVRDGSEGLHSLVP
jgi:hypothetical protein